MSPPRKNGEQRYGGCDLYSQDVSWGEANEYEFFHNPLLVYTYINTQTHTHTLMS